jgi:hypothetical protein
MICIVSCMGSGILVWWWPANWAETSYLRNITVLCIHLWIRIQRRCHLNYIIVCPISWKAQNWLCKSKPLLLFFCESSYIIITSLFHVLWFMKSSWEFVRNLFLRVPFEPNPCLRFDDSMCGLLDYDVMFWRFRSTFHQTLCWRKSDGNNIKCKQYFLKLRFWQS